LSSFEAFGTAIRSGTSGP